MGFVPPPEISENIKVYCNPTKTAICIIIPVVIIIIGIGIAVHVSNQDKNNTIISYETGILTDIQFQNTPIGGILGGIRYETILEINNNHKICLCGTRNDLIIGKPITIKYKKIYGKKRIEEINQH